jgi:hypothetical protein
MFHITTTAQRTVNGTPVPARIYRNEQTGSELVTYQLYKDKAGNTWWTFEDLFTLPFIRQLAAKRVLDLYGHGLAIADIKAYATQLKTLLRGTESDKYERAYAKVLEMEDLTEKQADPVKQCIGLCTVYLLLNDERPDVYAPPEQAVKMSHLALDLDAQAFFLRWWTGIMKHSGKVLNSISQIASTINGR